MACGVGLFAALMALQPSGATPPSEPINPRASELFERAPALKAWAIRFHDRNGDGWLTAGEASEAAAAFRTMADADRDGRVTTGEYAAALAFIRARY